MNACFSEEERMALAEEIPAGRFGTTEEVATLALQLAESPTYLTGQILTIDGAGADNNPYHSAPYYQEVKKL